MLNWQSKAVKLHRISFFSLCTLLGALANLSAVTLPIAVPLTVGNIAIFVVLARLGPLWGLLCFALVALPLTQPLAIALSAAQTLLFLLYLSRRESNILTFTALYTPIAAAICWALLPGALGSKLPLVVLYVLLCALLFTLCVKAANMLLVMSVQAKLLRQQPLQNQLSYRFGLYTAIPATLLITLGLNAATSVSLVKQMADYHFQLATLKSDVEFRLNEYSAKVQAIAGLSASQSDKTLLEQLVIQQPEFISALTTDSDGVVTNFYKADVTDNRLIGNSVEDRAYFFMVKNTQDPYISDTFTGRSLGQDQLFAVSAPIMANGNFIGILQLSVQLNALLEVFKSASDKSSHQILLDNAGKKIWSHKIDGEVGSLWQRPQQATALPQVFLKNSIFNPFEPIILSTDAHHFILTDEIGATGWSLNYFIDTEPTILVFYLYFAIALGLITFILEASVLLSKRFVGHYTLALEQLVDYTKHWDGKSQDQMKPEFAQSAREIDTLTESFINMQRRVAGAHHAILASMQEVRQLNSELEQRVELRTHELEQERDKANHLAAVKTRFLANMSHELRTPITIIKGFTEELIAVDKGAGRDALCRIQQNTEHLHNVVNDILDVAKMDAGKMSFAPTSINALALLDDIAASLSQLCQPKQLITVINTDLPAGLSIWADPFRLKQILLNLVSNAVKFTQHGQITLLAEFCDNIEISLQDQGVGIAADKIPTLFQAFTQADSSISRDYGGTGLGLYISKELADAMGMTLTVQSELHHGSTFTLTIPEKLVSITAQKKMPDADVAIHVTDNRHQGKRVLVVDDVKDIRDLIASLLHDTGLELTFAQDGYQALAIIEKQAFDLIIMDQQMPRMDGLTAALNIRQRGIFTPMVQLSADVFSEQTDIAPFNSIMTKPIDKAALRRTINQLLSIDLVDNNQGIAADSDDELAMEYLQSLNGVRDKLLQLFNGQHYTQLASEAHKIKGTSACFGFHDVAEAASLLELKLKQNSPDHELLTTLMLVITSINKTEVSH